MKCDDVQDKFDIFGALSEEDTEREAMEAHLLDCEHCSEQYRLWEESEEMIRKLSEEDEVVSAQMEHVNRSVMDRIYAEQSWLMPVSQKSYYFSPAFRRNLAIVLSACLAVFVCSFIFFINGNDKGTSEETMAQITGLMDTANASGSDFVVSAEFEVPVASVSDPFVLQVVPTFPQYWVALSMLGIVMSLLILNWLSRTRN
ncbi:zf-HC2 domain-containing protein [Paenibacillus glycanilyticus]|uniref:anti-sigma factor n=1 Tax=Paenibacillus glycanilyticus TaxID=126569 RepID=UPI00203C746D|nr:zf-HC2 domain-containing protein [Paenibacillus glycanilyticus]MCM3627472.1 zf-HC2 domain-containing protein [Paenibacillus glycanilyticus]